MHGAVLRAMASCLRRCRRAAEATALHFEIFRCTGEIVLAPSETPSGAIVVAGAGRWGSSRVADVSWAGVKAGLQSLGEEKA